MLTQVRKIEQDVRDMIGRNAHCDAAALIGDTFGQADELLELEGIRDEQRERGFITEHDYARRNRLVDQILARMATTSPDAARVLKAAL